MAALDREKLTQQAKSLGLYLWALARRFWFCWVMVWISLTVKENYPFSHNPMYARWDPHTFVLYTTDENDNVLFFYNEFGQTAVKLKKIVKTREKLIEKERPELTEEERYALAGTEALEHYHKTRLPKVENPAPYKTLKLWRMDMVLGENEVKKDKFVMSTYTPES